MKWNNIRLPCDKGKPGPQKEMCSMYKLKYVFQEIWHWFDQHLKILNIKHPGKGNTEWLRKRISLITGGNWNENIGFFPALLLRGQAYQTIFKHNGQKRLWLQDLLISVLWNSKSGIPLKYNNVCSNIIQNIFLNFSYKK